MRAAQWLVTSGAFVLAAACTAVAPADADLADVRWFARLERVYGGGELEQVGFGSVLGVARTEDGSVLVLDGKAAHVVELTPDGQPRRTYGRRGSGPGELSAPYQFGVHGDSVWIGDARLRRLTVFARGNGSSRTMSLDRYTGADRGAWAPEAMLSDGSLLALEQRATTAQGVPAALRRFRSDGRSEHMLSVPPYASWEFIDDHGSRRRRVHPLQFRTARSYARNGAYVAFVTAHPDADSSHAYIEIVRHAIADGTVLRRRVAYEPRPVTSQWLDHLVDTLLATSQPATRTRAREELASTGTLPPIRGVMAATDGSVWFGRADQPGNEWVEVVDAVAPPRRVELPVGFLPFDVRGDSMWGIHRDSLRGNTVGLLRITRGDALSGEARARRVPLSSSP
jgi:hypothetical protein